MNGNLFNDEVDFEKDWIDDARRYFTNIVGKYGMQVQALLKKAAGLDIQMICPLHGPVWRNNLNYFIEKHDKWSKYEPEDQAIAIIYGSIYGNTEQAADALAVDHGEVLYQDSFDRKLAGEIISAILEKKDAEFTCSAKDYHYLMPKTKRFHDHMLYEVKNECRFVNSMEEMTAPIMKLAVFEPAGLTEESVKYWMDRFGKECVVVTSGNEWIDFIPFGTNKAKGIREYQKRYHISPEECIAFGDEYNDIEMLKAVKYGFAMEHSKEGVRAATSYMTKQVEPVLEKLIRAKGKIEEVI